MALLAVASVFAEEAAPVDQEGQDQFLSAYAYGYGLHYPYVAPTTVQVVKTGKLTTLYIVVSFFV